MPDQRFVGYCRSSTPEQVIGIQIQRERIEAHARHTGGEVIAWYVEMRPASPVASKIGRHQPELCRALAHCRDACATLLVARLDRLTRSAAFFTSLLESGPPVVIAELPNASRFVLQIYAAVAEEYLERVSRRVLAAKERARAEGRNLNPQAKKHARRMHLEARTRNRLLCTQIEEIRRGRPMAASDVAQELNERGSRTRRGRLPWTEATVFELWHQFHRRWRSTRFPGRPWRPAAGSHAAALARAEAMRSRVAAYRTNGARRAQDICDRLNADHVRTVTGGEWSLGTTHKLLQRLRSAEA